MIEGNVIALLERETIGTIGGIEHTVDEYTVNIKIGLYFFVGDVKQLLLHLGRIIEAVVGLKLEVGSLSLTGKVLDSLRLGIGLRGVLTDERKA